MDDGCKATIVKGKRAGEICGKTPYGDTNKCWGHQSKEAKAAKGFGTAQSGGGRPRKPRTSEIYAEVAEEMREEIRTVLKRGLKATRHVVVGNGPEAHVEEIPDIPMQIKTAAELADRTDGKPRQAVEISGTDGGPIVTNVITDEKLAAEARDVLRRAAATS